MMPCGTVPKNDDALRVHRPQLCHEFNGILLNSALFNHLISYHTFKAIEARVQLLSQVSWYFKLDLKIGYQQISVRPKD